MNTYIRLNKVTYEYKSKKPIIKELSLSLDKKTFTVLLGANGSGKTTLTKLIMGILKPMSGSVHIDGVNTSELTLGQIGSKVGYVFQNPDHQIFGTTVFDQLVFSSRFLGYDMTRIYKRAEELLELFHLESYKETYPYYMSIGEKKSLAIASVLMKEPEYLILDEPTASLDAERRDVLAEILSNNHAKGIGTFVITHDMEFTKDWGQRILRLEGGRICNDSVQRT